MTEVILVGVDLEHLDSALKDGLGTTDRPVSFGTSLWPAPARA